MILPTLWIDLLDRKGADRYGQTRVQKKPVRVKVAPVRLVFDDDHTTVRTDSSGTHGAARETVAKVVVLARPRSGIEKGDLLVILGHRVKVAGLHVRYTVTGAHDHDELHCESA